MEIIEVGAKDMTASPTGQTDLLRRLIDAIPDYLFVKDEQSRIIINNIAHARNLGTVPDACVGKTDRDFFPPHLAEMYIAAEHNVVKHGCVYQNEEETVDRKGRRRWVLTTKIPIHDHCGKTIGMAGINHDITEVKIAQRALEESETRHRTLYHNTPVMLHSVDANGIILHVSDYWLNCLGYTRNEVIGRQSLEFYTEASRASFLATSFPEFLRVGHINDVPLEILTKDGRIVFVEVSLAAECDPEGNVIGGLAVSINVTQRRKAEAEREELHQRLLEMSRHAGMAEVATGVLHNVGNVLNSVNVSTGILTDKIKNSPVKKLARAVDLMTQHQNDLGTFITADAQGSKLPGYFTTVTKVLQSEEASVLEELGVLAKNIDHIKEIVRLQQTFAKAKGVMGRLDLAALIDDAARISGTGFEGRMIHVECDFPRPLFIHTDKHVVLQILTNLVKNAHQAVRENNIGEKKVSIRARLVVEKGVEMARIEVTDTGVGIQPDNLTRIFNHGFTTKANGHGFGLHSAANTAKRLGGTLEATSDGPGKGATFILMLPNSTEVSIK